MNKAEMVKAIAAGACVTEEAAGRVIDRWVNAIADVLEGDGRIAVGGLGVFKVVERAAVSRPNPQDRTEIIHTPARNTVTFKPTRALKEAVQ
jgi:nucleoid DNA-binding protein